MQMNEDLKSAFELLENTDLHLFLTGKAGTGKTTFLKMLKERTSKRMIVTAPTGVAAINAGGVTLHSFFQLPFTPYLPETNKSLTDSLYTRRFKKEKIDIIKSLDLLVIDEISMVRADVLDAVSEVLSYYRNNDKPFGGVQLLLIGDLQQLAPVVKEEEWSLLSNYYSSVYFFESKALLRSHYVCIELKQVYRQKDTFFLHLLNHIRDNQLDDQTLDALNCRYIPNFNTKQNKGYIMLTTHNYQAQQINKKRLEELSGEIYTFPAQIKDDFPEYAFPTDQTLELKIGAQVMFIKNDTSGERKYYNGKIGHITSIGRNIIVVTDEQGLEIEVKSETWDNTKYEIDADTKEIKEKIIGSFQQYPLKTAWAITIHKSQGLTFERAIIDVADAFQPGQVYVALSRCKTLEGLVLNRPITKDVVMEDPNIQRFNTKISSFYPSGPVLQAAERDYFMRQICELFNFEMLQKRIQYASYIINKHLLGLYPEMCHSYNESTIHLKENVMDVGNKFAIQLQQLVVSYPETYRIEPIIIERVIKGTDYFEKQLHQWCDHLSNSSDLEIDNKEIKKIVTKALDNFQGELYLKLCVIRSCSKGFVLSDYLAAKAKASLGEKTKKNKKKKKNNPIIKVTVSTDILHPDLYERVRSWRYQKATERGLPAYMILHQKALLGITNTCPENEADLLSIPGVGNKFITDYGEEILKIVHEYKKCQSC